MNPFEMPEADKDKLARPNALQNVVTFTYDFTEEELQRDRDRRERAGTGVWHSFPVVTLSYSAGEPSNDE